MLTGLNTQSSPHTCRHSLKRTYKALQSFPDQMHAWLTTYAHTSKHTQRTAAQRSYLNWCECCHDIRLVLFVPQKPWRERAGSPHWLSCKSIQHTHKEYMHSLRSTHIRRYTHKHLIVLQISKKAEKDMCTSIVQPKKKKNHQLWDKINKPNERNIWI